MSQMSAGPVLLRRMRRPRMQWMTAGAAPGSTALFPVSRRQPARGSRQRPGTSAHYHLPGPEEELLKLQW